MRKENVDRKARNYRTDIVMTTACLGLLLVFGGSEKRGNLIVKVTM